LDNWKDGRKEEWNNRKLRHYLKSRFGRNRMMEGFGNGIKEKWKI
jgi:hypothetical protein